MDVPIEATLPVSELDPSGLVLAKEQRRDLAHRPELRGGGGLLASCDDAVIDRIDPGRSLSPHCFGGVARLGQTDVGITAKAHAAPIAIQPALSDAFVSVADVKIKVASVGVLARPLDVGDERRGEAISSAHVGLPLWLTFRSAIGRNDTRTYATT